MGTQEKVELVRRGHEAFDAGDVDTLRELFAEDAVWHGAGNGVLSGTKQGREAILAPPRAMPSGHDPKPGGPAVHWWNGWVLPRPEVRRSCSLESGPAHPPRQKRTVEQDA